MKNTVLVKSEKKNKELTVEQLIKRLLGENTDGGTIFLSDFCAQVPSTPKAEVIRQLKASDEGVFVSGRHGRPSRWVYGEMAESVSRPAENIPTTNRISNHRANGKDTIDITVSVGNQEATVSFNKLELLSSVLTA